MTNKQTKTLKIEEEKFDTFVILFSSRVEVLAVKSDVNPYSVHDDNPEHKVRAVTSSLAEKTMPFSGHMRFTPVSIFDCSICLRM